MKTQKKYSVTRKTAAKGNGRNIQTKETTDEIGTWATIETIQGLSAKLFLGKMTASDVAESFGLPVTVVQYMRDDIADYALYPRICDHWQVSQAIRGDLLGYLREIPMSPNITRVDQKFLANLVQITDDHEFKITCSQKNLSVERMRRLCGLFTSGSFSPGPGPKSSQPSKADLRRTGSRILKGLDLYTLQRCTTFSEKHILLVADLLASGCRPVEVSSLMSRRYSRQLASQVWIVATAVRYGRLWSNRPLIGRIHQVVDLAIKEEALGDVDWLQFPRLTRAEEPRAD